MTRNFILFMVVAVIAVCLHGPAGVARGESPDAGTQVAAEPPAPSELPVLRDSFDDNQKGKLWNVYQEDPNGWVIEANKRLEFGAAADVNGAFAGYVGGKWWIDPNHDFSMKVDLHYDLVTYGEGRLTFGLTPDPEDPRNQYISLGIGCVNRYPSYWHEWKEDYEIRWDSAGRVRDDVTMYMSYQAFTDELYVSDVGYGSENAWQTFPDFIWGRWGHPRLYVFLGGTTDDLKIDSGHAFFDNFVIESGAVVKPPEWNEPPEPNDPNDPNDPNSPGGFIEPDVMAEVLVIPSSITRRNTSDPLTASVILPQSIRAADVDRAEPLRMRPGNLKGTKQTIFVWLTGRVIVTASFSRAELMQAVTDNGNTELQVFGKLKDGRYFGGTDTVTIK